MNSPERSESFRPRTTPRSAYIHIPFCRHRCGYCNFALVADRDYLIDGYLDSLATEIGWLDQSYGLDTLFFGGGTPSHLNEQQLRRLGEIVRQRFTLNPNAEVTAECNPCDMTPETIDGLSAMGVNRISLGVQSFNSAKLKTLERDHDGDIAQQAILDAKRVFGNVSLDLIFATPSESLDDWIVDLKTGLALSPTHLSTYELTFEKGTQFWNRLVKGKLSQSDEEVRAQMYESTMKLCEKAELQQYEVSSFSQHGFECRHNQIYWSGDPYFAFGPGASRFIDGVRETNHSSTMAYMRKVKLEQSPVADSENLEPLAAAKERLAIGLRVVKGVHYEQFKQRTGFEVLDVLGSSKEMLVEHGLIEVDIDRCRLTDKGRMVSDGIAAEILGESQGDN